MFVDLEIDGFLCCLHRCVTHQAYELYKRHVGFVVCLQRSCVILISIDAKQVFVSRMQVFMFYVWLTMCPIGALVA